MAGGRRGGAGGWRRRSGVGVGGGEGGGGGGGEAEAEGQVRLFHRVLPFGGGEGGRGVSVWWDDCLQRAAAGGARGGALHPDLPYWLVDLFGWGRGGRRGGRREERGAGLAGAARARQGGVGARLDAFDGVRLAPGPIALEEVGIVGGRAGRGGVCDGGEDAERGATVAALVGGEVVYWRPESGGGRWGGGSRGGTGRERGGRDRSRSRQRRARKSRGRQRRAKRRDRNSRGRKRPRKGGTVASGGAGDDARRRKRIFFCCNAAEQTFEDVRKHLGQRGRESPNGVT